MDEEIKKLLVDLKMEDLLKQFDSELSSEQKKPPTNEPEELQDLPVAEETVVFQEPLDVGEPVQKGFSFFSKPAIFSLLFISLFAIVGATLWYNSGPAVEEPQVDLGSLIAYEDEEEDADFNDGPYGDFVLSNTAWAKKINEKDEKIGDGVRSLWTLLRNRQEDLENISDEITDLLDDNAFIHRNFFIDQANTLFARYTASDSRYTLEISQQITLLNSMVEKKQDDELTLVFAEMLNELGCDEYRRYRQEIVTALVDEGIAWRRALDLVKKADSLSQLDVALDQGLKDLEQMRKTSVTELFVDTVPFRKQLTLSVQQCVEYLLVQSNIDIFAKPENRAFLQSILGKSGIEGPIAVNFMRKFDSIAKAMSAAKNTVQKKSLSS